MSETAVSVPSEPVCQSTDLQRSPRFRTTSPRSWRLAIDCSVLEPVYPLLHLFHGEPMSKRSGLIILFTDLLRMRLPSLNQGEIRALRSSGELRRLAHRQSLHLQLVVH